MIPVCLVTGFLGSGKTTFLRNRALSGREGKLIYIVNDFADIAVDAKLYKADGRDVISLAGGSIFCTCMVSDFRSQLGAILEGSICPVDEIDGIVIEASGVADPRVIHRMLAEGSLKRQLALKRIITVVEPDSLIKLGDRLPNIKAQVDTADVVLINKCDLYTEQRVAEAENVVEKMHPGVEMDRVEYGKTNLPLFANASVSPVEGEYSLCDDPHFATLVHEEDVSNMKILMQGLSNLASCIYRAKGFVRHKGTVGFLDFASGVVNWTVCETSTEPTGLAFIVRKDSHDMVDSWLANQGVGRA